LTAAVCSWNFQSGTSGALSGARRLPRRSQMQTLLSFPPLASVAACGAPSPDHLSPHTSCRCATLRFHGAPPGSRTSRWWICRSREPEVSTFDVQPSAPIRISCASW
jgi:hypothetical protein